MVQGAPVAQQRFQLATLQTVLRSNASKRHDGISGGLAQCRMAATLPTGGRSGGAVTHEAVTVSLGEAAVQPAEWREVTQSPCVAGTTLRSDGILADCRPSVHVGAQLRCCDPQGAMSCGSPMPRGEGIAKPAGWGQPTWPVFAFVLQAEEQRASDAPAHTLRRMRRLVSPHQVRLGEGSCVTPF